MVILDNQNKKNEVTKICNEPGISVKNQLKNEQELKLQKIDYKVGKFPFAASGRALAVDQSVGFVKVLSHKKTDTILGVHVFGPAAAEIVQQALISMEFGASSEDIALTMFSHPTVSEAFHEAALASNNQAINIGNKSK